MKRIILFCIFLFLLSATFSLAVTYENQDVRLTVTPDTAYSWYGNFWQNYEIENKMSSEKCVNLAFLFDKQVTKSFVGEYSQEAYDVSVPVYETNEVCEWIEANQTNECHQETVVNYIQETRYRTIENDLTSSFDYQRINPNDYNLNTNKTHAYSKNICIPAETTVSGRINYKYPGTFKWDLAVWNTDIAWFLDPWANNSRYTHDFDNIIDINTTLTTLNVDTANSRLSLSKRTAGLTDLYKNECGDISTDYRYYDSTGDSRTSTLDININDIGQASNQIFTVKVVNFFWDTSTITDHPRIYLQDDADTYISRAHANSDQTGGKWYYQNGASLLGTTNARSHKNLYYNITFMVDLSTDKVSYSFENESFQENQTNMGLKVINDFGEIRIYVGEGTVSWEGLYVWNGTTCPMAYNRSGNYLRSTNITSNSSQGNFQQVKLIANDNNATGGIRYNFSCNDGADWEYLINDSYVTCPVTGNDFMYAITLNGTSSYSPFVYDVAFDFTFAPAVNIPPTQSAPILNSTYGTNYTNENLTCYNQSTYDANGDLVTNIFSWYKNSNPLNGLYLPFETNFTDYSGSGNTVTNNGTIIGEGKIGNGSYFDGADYVKVDDSPALDFSSDKSWEIWFKRLTTGSETLFDKSDGNTTNYRLEFNADNKLVFSYSIPAGAAGNFSWETSTSEEFGEGTYSNTVYDTDHVELSSGQSSGSYASKIFDATELASWKSIDWTEELPYGEELPDNKGAGMSGNVLLMHLNEASGTIEDTSGENNDGTNYGAAYGANGRFNDALSFDGVNDYVNVGTANLPTGSNSRTMEAWFKTTAKPNAGVIFLYGTATGSQAFYLDVGTLTDCGSEGGSNSNGTILAGTWGAGSNVCGTISVTDGNWHHAAAVYNGTHILVYIDSVLRNSGPRSANTVIGSANIGRSPSGTYYFNGVIDEVAVYSRALSSTEILEHYKRGILNLDLKVRSCDDSACSGESFTDVADNPPQDLSVGNDQYFQYRFNFTTEDMDYSPELSGVIVNYTLFNGEATETSLTSASAVTNTAWHHAVVTFDDTGTNNFKLYLDNSLDASKTEANLPNYKDNDLYIGKDYAETSFFTGNLDEFRIYDHVLSSEQVSNNFNLNYNKVISSETTRGESYICSITPTDGFGDGITKNSSSLTIRNYIPITPTLLNPANGYSSGVLPEFNWTASTDIDPGDTISYILEISTDSNFAYLNYSNTLTDTKDENVVLDSSVIKTYYWKVLATDGIGNSSWSSVRNFTYARWNVSFNVTSGEFTQEELNNVNISYCNYTGFSQAGDTTNPYGPYGFPPGNWMCSFKRINYYEKTITFEVDDDRVVNVILSEEKSLTDEEHTWLEALYNCIILKDCDLYNLLLQINQTVSNTWQHIKPTDTSVITSETKISNTLNSTHNITYDYTISIPIKAGYNLGAYLPVRIGFWFMNESNTSCYNQGTLPEGVTVIKPYCNPLMVQTLGPMGGSVSFRVDLRPNLAIGTYNVKRIIEIDPNDEWEGYGQEVIDTIQVTEDMTEDGAIGLDKTGEKIPKDDSGSSSSSSGGGGGGGGRNNPITNIYQNITYIINQPESNKETKEREEENNERKSRGTEEYVTAESGETKPEEKGGLGSITGSAIGIFKDLSGESVLVIVIVTLFTIIVGLVGYIFGYRKK